MKSRGRAFVGGAMLTAIVSFVLAGSVGPWPSTPALADDERNHHSHERRGHSGEQRSGFALINQTSAVGDVSATCGAVGEERQAISFIMYITLTSPTSGSVRVIYRDLNFVEYGILANTTVQISLAAGSKLGKDDAIEVMGTNGATPIGQVSISTTEEDARPNPVINTSLCTTTPAGGTSPIF